MVLVSNSIKMNEIADCSDLSGFGRPQIGRQATPNRGRPDDAGVVRRRHGEVDEGRLRRRVRRETAVRGHVDDAVAGARFRPLAQLAGQRVRQMRHLTEGNIPNEHFQSKSTTTSLQWTRHRKPRGSTVLNNSILQKKTRPERFNMFLNQVQQIDRTWGVRETNTFWIILKNVSSPHQKTDSIAEWSLTDEEFQNKRTVDVYRPMERSKRPPARYRRRGTVRSWRRAWRAGRPVGCDTPTAGAVRAGASKSWATRRNGSGPRSVPGQASTRKVTVIIIVDTISCLYWTFYPNLE